MGNVVSKSIIVASGALLLGAQCVEETAQVNPCDEPDVVEKLASLCPSRSNPDFTAKGSASCEANVGLSEQVSLESIGGVCRKSGECNVLCRSACTDGTIPTYVDDNSLICGEAKCRPGEARCGVSSSGVPARFICRADGKEFNEFACASGEQCREYDGDAQCAPPCPDPDRMYRDEQGLCRCEEGYVFNETSRRCERCMPDCAGRECGDDPLCGQSCGTCETGTSCQAGLCEQCDCGEQECGQGPCGLFCGDCATNARCTGGRCVTDEPEEPPLSNICCVGLAGSCPMLSAYPAGTACFCVDIYNYIYYGEVCTL